MLGLRRLVTGLGALPDALAAANLSAMKSATLYVEAEAKARVPRRTGRLQSSITSDVTEDATELVGSVSTDVDYAAAVESGSQPHEIAAINASALMVPVASIGGFGGGRLSGAARAGQQVAFFRRVRHPGNRAEPFLGPALTDNTSTVQDFFTAAANKVLGLVKGV